MRIPHQLYHFSYTQLPQIKYRISNMANMTIMIWNFRAFFHVRSGLESLTSGVVRGKLFS